MFIFFRRKFHAFQPNFFNKKKKKFGSQNENATYKKNQLRDQLVQNGPKWTKVDQKDQIGQIGLNGLKWTE